MPDDREAKLNKRVSDVNKRALSCVSAGKLLEAQTLLRQNKKRCRCNVTLHNLGLFYCENNILSETLRETDGSTLALRFLKEAWDLHETAETAFALAETYDKKDQQDAAAHFFARSNELKQSVEAMYNCGCALYNAKKYGEASHYFKRAIDICSTDRRDEILAAYAFSLAYAKDSGLSHAEASTLLSLLPEDMLYERFFLSYHIGLYDVAGELVDSVIKQFSHSDGAHAVIIDVLLRNHRVETALQYGGDVIDRMKDSAYNRVREIALIKQSLQNEKYRRAISAEYRYKVWKMKRWNYLE